MERCGKKVWDEAFRDGRSSAAWRARPSVAGKAGDRTRDGDCGADCFELWSERVFDPVERSVLVSVVRGCDGDGLAFVGDHYLGDGSVEARVESTIFRVGPGDMGWTRAAFEADT